MNWITLWISLFGRASLLGIDMGFWVAMAAVCLIVLLMNAIFWGMKPKNRSDPSGLKQSVDDKAGAPAFSFSGKRDGFWKEENDHRQNPKDASTASRL